MKKINDKNKEELVSVAEELGSSIASISFYYKEGEIGTISHGEYKDVVNLLLNLKVGLLDKELERLGVNVKKFEKLYKEEQKEKKKMVA